MPSQPLETTSWDFGPVLDLIDSDATDFEPPSPLHRPSDINLERTNGKSAVTLGSFSKLWERLGISIDEPLPAISIAEPESEDQSSSDDAALFTSSDGGKLNAIKPNNVDEPETSTKRTVEPPKKTVGVIRIVGLETDTNEAVNELEQSSDDPYAGMTRKQRYKARQRATKARQADEQKQKEHDHDEQARHMIREQPIQTADEAKLNTHVDAIPKGRLARSRSSRSNIGAKNGPATPIKIQCSASVQKLPDTPTLVVSQGQPLTAPLAGKGVIATPLPAGPDVPFHLFQNITQPTGLGSFGPTTPNNAATNSFIPVTYTGPGAVHVNNNGLKQASMYAGPPPGAGKRPTAAQKANPSTPLQPAQSEKHYTIQQAAATSSQSYFPPNCVPLDPNHPGLQPFGSKLQPSPMATSNAPSAHTNLDATLHAQYTPVSAPIAYQNQYPPVVFTPTNGNPHVLTPHHAPKGLSLVPSTVQPVINISRKTQKVATRSREDMHFDFLQRLMRNFPEDKKWLVSPMRLSSDKMSPEGIHVFVDASNILIGFKELMRRTPGYQGVYDMSFDCLALLLERRRAVAKRVYAGSTRVNAKMQSNEKFNELAGAVGYEQNIYEQVFKTKELTDRQKFFMDVDRVGFARATQMRSGNGSSDSETGAIPTTPAPAPKWVEQGVDESLHLKMCQSIIDCDVPSTMILATGDGNEAEYSDGFLAHVERALKKGWKVELVSWKQQTSSGYKKKSFRAKWGENFKIIELDEYLDFMIDV